MKGVCRLSRGGLATFCRLREPAERFERENICLTRSTVFCGNSAHGPISIGMERSALHRKLSRASGLVPLAKSGTRCAHVNDDGPARLIPRGLALGHDLESFTVAVADFTQDLTISARFRAGGAPLLGAGFGGLPWQAIGRDSDTRRQSPRFLRLPCHCVFDPFAQIWHLGPPL